jgi:hypothetical protein
VSRTLSAHDAFFSAPATSPPVHSLSETQQQGSGGLDSLGQLGLGSPASDEGQRTSQQRRASQKLNSPAFRTF